MKKKKGMIVMLCVLCVLLAVYFVLQNQNVREKEKEKAQEEADIIYVTDTDAANITSFSLNMGNGALSFEKRGGQWYYADDEDFPLDQSIPEQITEEISQITADRELEDGDALEDYGLDEPEYTLNYTEVVGLDNALEFVHFMDFSNDSTLFVRQNGKIQPLLLRERHYHIITPVLVPGNTDSDKNKNEQN